LWWPDGSADGNRPRFQHTAIADQEPFQPQPDFNALSARPS
jgi:hypothetical protein